MLNYETLLSSYDDKLTLLQWLKKVEEALKGASAVSFKVNKRGDATLTFSVLFEDGSELETSPIILQQGESVQGAAIRNGHLILTLTNDDELDAGNLGAVSGFSINASQHLIITYQNGTTQDLGAIFTGDVAIAGNLAAEKLEQKTANYSQDIYYATPSNSELTNLYCNCKVINGVMYLVVNLKIKNLSEDSQTYYYISAAGFKVPNSVAEKLIDMDGETAVVAKDVNTLIASDEMQIFSSWTDNPTPMSDTDNNRAALNLLNGTESSYVVALIAGNMTIPAGETRILTGRIPLTLI